MTPNVLPSDRIRLMACIDPDAIAASTVTSGWVDAGKFASWLALIAAGDLGASATLDAKIQQAQDGSGTGAKDITGKAITQLTQAGTDSDKQALINLRPEELDVAGGFTHIRISMTIATATSEAAAFLFGIDARFEPETDKASVDEIVS